MTTQKNYAWFIAILSCVGMVLITITPAWIGALILGFICGLVFEPWKHR